MFGSMREKRGQGIGDHFDALIWACCASGKAGIRMGGIVRVCYGLSLAPKSVGLLTVIGSEAPGGPPGLQRDCDGRPGERSTLDSLTLIVASQLHISPYKSRAENASSSETRWRAIYLAKKCVLAALPNLVCSDVCSRMRMLLPTTGYLALPRKCTVKYVAGFVISRQSFRKMIFTFSLFFCVEWVPSWEGELASQ